MFEPQAPRLQIVLIESDRRLRRSIAGILEVCDRVQAVATAADLPAALDLISDVRPAAVLVDLEPQAGGPSLELVRALRSSCLGATVVALADDPHCRIQALAAGADLAVSLSAVAENVCQVLARIPVPAKS